MATNKNILFIAIAIAVVANIFSWQMPFFWDTILTSTITQQFYENGFQNFITAAQFDAGHPPLFYIYVTSFFFLFGKSLFAAHLSILPFTILGILSFLNILQHFYFTKKSQFIGIILFFSIPAVITQNCLVSYDAVLLSLYLFAIIAILKNKKLLLSIILIALVGISLRGLFCLVSLSITVFFLQNKNIKSWLKWNLFFVPSIIIILSWFYYHYTQTGWFLSTNADAWSSQRGFVNALGLFKNGISIARCFFDLGIVIISLITFFYCLQKRKFDNYILLFLIPFIVFSIAFLPFNNPINHRYFLIIYVLMLLPVLQFLANKKIIYSIFTTIILLLGHFFIYPVPISNAWDCTLQNLSYNKLIEDFNHKNQTIYHIDKAKIGTVFPIDASLYQTHLQLNKTRMINVNDKSIDSIPYILFSNIGNDFSDEQIKQIKTWKLIYQSKNGLVEMILFQNSNFH